MSSNQTLKTMTIIHYTLMLGMVIFGIIVYSLNEKWELILSITDDIFFLVVPIVAVFGVLVGSYIFKTWLNAIDKSTSLNDQLTRYQTALIVKDALIEGPCLLGIIAALLSGNLYYFIIVIALIIYFYSQRPTLNGIEKDLNLDSSQMAELRNDA